MNSPLHSDNSIAALRRCAPLSRVDEFHEEARHAPGTATPDTGRFLRRMENQSDESDEIAPAQLLQAAHTTAATAQQARFLMRCRRSYSLPGDEALLLEDSIVCKARLGGTASGVRENNRGDCCMLLPLARLSKSQFGVLG
jgi:hypothetical protein